MTSPAPSIESPDVDGAVEQIARGDNGLYEGTFTHPRHGELTFRGGLPTALQQMRHAVAMDNYLNDLAVVDLETGARVQPRQQTSILAAALAGMADSLLLEMPVVARHEVEDDERGSIRVQVVRYDPLSEPDIVWLCTVWLAYSAWRGALLTPEAVKTLGNA